VTFSFQSLKRRRRKYVEIDPDEVLLDSSNLPQFDRSQMEGRLERPISRLTLYTVSGIFLAFVLVFLIQAWNLQVVHGSEYLQRSENNLLRPIPIFAGRGVIYDRNGSLLAWNDPGEGDISRREYATSTGLAHVLGYVQYPSKDSNGFYYQEDFEGVAGVEKYYNDDLQGVNGSRLVEVDAHGAVVSQNVVKPAEQGTNLDLSIDSRIQSTLYNNIKDIADRVGFSGGAGVIMDVRTGELIALTSYPEYSSQVMSDKTDTAAVKALLTDKNLPFLDRAVDGLYTPGSVVKPYIGIGALAEGTIDPNKIFHTTGSISIPNPYDPTKTTVFRDWKDNGDLDLRHAIEMSSDAYFYILGGGYMDQKGLGIANIDKYLRMFGIGELMPESFAQGKAGTIPTPEWKQKTFGESWYLGDTYHTSIGQYGVQVTPVQMVRAVAAMANEGTLLVPTILKTSTPEVERTINIPQQDFQIIHEGMRLSAEAGTSKALNVPYVTIGAKSGTAELGAAKENVNSWITGFWPYENPRYAFAVTLEKGSVHNLIGAAAAMRQELDWMSVNTPEYFKVQ